MSIADTTPVQNRSPFYYHKVVVPKGGWVKLIRHTDQLALPKDCTQAKDIPVEFLADCVIGVSPWDFLIVATPVSEVRSWGNTYTITMFGYTNGEPHWWTIPYGAQHKAYIKQVGGHADLLPGAGHIAMIVREIHAIRRKIFSVPFKEELPIKKQRKPRKPTAAQLERMKLREQFAQDRLENSRARRRDLGREEGWFENFGLESYEGEDHGQD